MKRIIKRWARPLIKTNIISGLIQYRKFISDWRAFQKMEGAERF